MVTAAIGKIRCALCGRVTLDPAVWVGSEPIGPKCARRAGLLEQARTNKRIRVNTVGASHGKNRPKRDPKTLDLFAVAA